MPAGLYSKSFKLDFSSVNSELQDTQLGFKETEEPEIKLLTYTGSWSKRISGKHLLLLHCVDHNKLWKILRDGTILSVFWEICMWIKKQQLEPDMEQQTGSKLGKMYDKAVYYHPAYLTSMQSTSYEMLGWMKHKLESRLLGEISINSYAHDITQTLETEEELKSLSMRVKEDSEKTGSKLNI